MRPTRLTALVILAALLLSPLLSSAKDGDKSIIQAANRAQFAELTASIREEMQPQGRFQFVTETERTSVNQYLDTIAGILAQGDPDTLHYDVKMDLLAAQENANAILTQRDGNRMICERRSPTGSHFKVKKCMTYAEQVKLREDAQKDFSDNKRSSPARACGNPNQC